MEKAIYKFEEYNPEYGLNNYISILKEHVIEWSDESMENADVINMEAPIVLALLLGVFRAERFSKRFFEKRLHTEMFVKT